MKLSDFLENVGRPIAYYPRLAQVVGGIKAAVFLCQLIYWRGKESDKHGWIYKTAEGWEEETGLSYREQAYARRELKRLKLVEEKHDRINHRMYYRLSLDDLNNLWDAQFPNLQKRNSGTDKSATPQLTKVQSVNRNTEITAETTDIESLPAPKARGRERPEERALLTLFCELTGIPEPVPTSAKEKKAVAVRWYQPIARMVKLANGNAPVIAGLAIQAMRQDGLTIAAPQSIESVFTSKFGESQRPTDNGINYYA